MFGVVAASFILVVRVSDIEMMLRSVIPKQVCGEDGADILLPIADNTFSRCEMLTTLDTPEKLMLLIRAVCYSSPASHLPLM